VIERADRLLIPTEYDPSDVGYRICVDGKWQEGKVFCENCIVNAVEAWKMVYPYAVVRTDRCEPDAAMSESRPLRCAVCGEYFFTEFTADAQEADELLRRVREAETLGEVDKWEIGMAFYNYRDCDVRVKATLRKIAGVMLEKWDKIENLNFSKEIENE
jgi:hypothetical protein